MSNQLKTLLELYDMEIHQKISVPNNLKLKNMVKRSMQWERVERDCLALKEEKVSVTGQCSKGDRCSFRHDTQDRSHKPEHTAATPPEPTVSRGRSVSRKRSLRKQK